MGNRAFGPRSKKKVDAYVSRLKSDNIAYANMIIEDTKRVLEKGLISKEFADLRIREYQKIIDSNSR